jgi:predicted peptidase
VGQNGNGGSELNKVVEDGLARLIEENKWPDARPFVVLSPQYVGQGGEIRAGSACPSSATVHAFLTWALANYEVDPKRVFITGLSCGAIGTWDYLAEHQGSVVAAYVLIAGNPVDPDQAGSTWARAGCTLGTAAIWSLHGDQDDVVPFAPDEATMAKLTACPSPPRRTATFTTLAGGGHNIWTPIYDLTGGQGDIYQWLLANSKQ